MTRMIGVDVKNQQIGPVNLFELHLGNHPQLAMSVGALKLHSLMKAIRNTSMTMRIDTDAKNQQVETVILLEFHLGKQA